MRGHSWELNNSTIPSYIRNTQFHFTHSRPSAIIAHSIFMDSANLQMYDAPMQLQHRYQIFNELIQGCMYSTCMALQNCAIIFKGTQNVQMCYVLSLGLFRGVSPPKRLCLNNAMHDRHWKKHWHETVLAFSSFASCIWSRGSPYFGVECRGKSPHLFACSDVCSTLTQD